MEGSSQKWKSRFPGSPIGQQHEGTDRRYCIGGDDITARTGGKADGRLGFGAGAGPGGTATVAGRITGLFEELCAIALASGGSVGPSTRVGAGGRWTGGLATPRRIGEGRAVRSRR